MEKIAVTVTTLERIEQSRKSRGLRNLTPEEVFMILAKGEYIESEIKEDEP
jgi:hypothetical protein